MATKEQDTGRQEGSRWINRRPEPKEFAEWFSANVKLHEGLFHADYLPGITLIPNKEKVREVAVRDDGRVEFVDVEQLVYAPYPKVETRIQYFWDLMALHPEWLGAIKLLAGAPKPNLPPGFFHMPVTVTDGRATHFIGVSYQVRITERSRRGQSVIEPAAGTKIVPLLKTGYGGRIFADENAIHKAQTGAQGRALGFAGMLIVPGAGIATAEDMLEFIAGDTPVAGAEASALPPVVGPEPADATTLEQLVTQLTERLRSDFPSAYEEAVAWAAEKGYDLTKPPAPALRGLERLLRRKLETAEQAAGSKRTIVPDLVPRESA